MRYVLLSLLAFANILPCCQGALVITEVMSSANGVGDWWELTNTGSSSVNLNGYYWDDDGPSGNDGALFGDFSITAGQSVIISEDPEAGFLMEWGQGIVVLDQTDFSGPDTFSGLSSGGDRIQLWDADPNAGAANLVAQVQFDAATTGVSFEWDTNGISLGLSAAGENGAYTSTAGDLGSPGTAVPEPGSLFCIAPAIACGLMRRKRC